MKLRVLDLFSGIGGFSLGLERTGGFETAAFCEYNEYCRKVLQKHWRDVPIYPDVRELTAERLDADGLGRIDLICGGYPCQPFSYAGKRNGAEDDRHLWPEMLRLVASLRPTWVIGENVAGHITMGLDDVLSDLDGLGYATQAFVIPACAVNAPHRRDRLWLVAYRYYAGQSAGARRGEDNRDEQRDNARRGGEAVANGESVRRREGEQDAGRSQAGTGPREEYGFGDGRQIVADTDGLNAQGQSSSVTDEKGWPRQVFRPSRPRSDGSGWWTPEPAVGRMAHGIPHRVDRLKALGNAVVPQIPEMIGRAILKSMEVA